jgi:hypothetical protein
MRLAPITTTTTDTLTCLGLDNITKTKIAAVTILPSFQEV